MCFPREARDLDLVREHHHHHHGRALGDSFLALGGGSRDAMGWLGRQLSGARRGGPVTQWALRAGISTHTAVFWAWKRPPELSLSVYMQNFVRNLVVTTRSSETFNFYEFLTNNSQKT